MPSLQSLLYFAFLLPFFIQQIESSVVPVAARQNAGIPLERRDQVAQCQAVLVALRASSFCSTFINLQDKTQTITATGRPATTTKTIPAALCTTTLGGSTTTTTLTSTAPGGTSTITSTVPITLPAGQVTETTTSTQTITSSATVTVYPTSGGSSKQKREVAQGAQLAPREPTTQLEERGTPTTCAIKGVPTKLNVFVCNVISSACSRYVQPRTSTVSTTVPGATATLSTTASALCATATPPVNTVTVSATVTGAGPTTTVIQSSTITPAPVTTTTTITQTVTTTATTTVTGTPYGTNDCVNGKQKPSALDGYVFQDTCGATLSFYTNLQSTTETSFSNCFNACIRFGACDAYIYNIATGECILSNGAYRGPVANPGFDTGVIIF